MASFKHANYDGYARLVYMDSQDIRVHDLEAWAAAKKLTVLKDESKMPTLRSLTRQHLVIQSEPRHMRGFDYRSADGLALFVAKQLETTRAMH